VLYPQDPATENAGVKNNAKLKKGKGGAQTDHKFGQGYTQASKRVSVVMAEK
jgi:hypothetical protein